ncbi:MAG: hypothetical protein J6X89_06455 [Bacteroidales bacterium]|nr:hypothetical protein [Bacteroidales bacterium]
MKKLYIILIAVALIAAGCQKEEKDQLEQLQKDLAAFQQEQIPGVPDSQYSELSEYSSGPLSFTFEKNRYAVDAGGSVTLSYTLEEAAEVSVIVREGWTAKVSGSGSKSGTITLTAPDPAVVTDLIVTATTPEGRRTTTVLPVMVRDPYTDATRTDVAAMGYYCFHPGIATDYHFQKMAECGMNMLTIESVDNWKEQLELAHKYGLKGVLFVNGPAGDYYRDQNSTSLSEIIAVAKDMPALAGYQIYDEPSTLNIGQIKYEKDRIEELDPNPAHPVYVNLHPSSASKGSLGVDDYFEYVETFVTECDLKFITFDQYPVYAGFMDPSWPRSLAAVRESALRHKIPFWAFTLCCREWNREDPTLENMRLQCNTNLAYGAQVNQFFVYRATSGTNYAPVMADGTYTTAYDICQDYCTEMHNRGYVFAGSDVPKVRKYMVIDSWSESLSLADLPPQINSLYTSRESVVSFVENKGNKYMVVVNSLWNWTQEVAIDVADMIYVIDHDGVFTELQPGISRFPLEGGDMLVFKYE